MLALLFLSLALALVPSQLDRPVCQVRGHGSRLDIARAEAACKQAVARYRQLFNRVPPRGVVELTDTLHLFHLSQTADRWHVYWPTSDRLREVHKGLAAVQQEWSTTLPHEIGHQMLSALVEPGKPPVAGRYGTLLPDWLDEAVAVWMEPEQARANEFRMIGRQRPAIPTVEELTRWNHPQLLTGQQPGLLRIRTFFPCPQEDACPGRPRWRETMRIIERSAPDGVLLRVDTTFSEGAPEPTNPIDTFFYPFSVSLLRFVHERGGSVAVDSLIRRLQHGEPANGSIVRLPGLPAVQEELEEDWLRWFTTTYLGDEPRTDADGPS